MHDPDGVEWRKGVRVMVVVPALLAVVGPGVGEVAGLFAVFAAFSLLVFADFGGEPSRKARAYVLATLVGAVGVVVGTLAAPFLVVAAVSLLSITFVVRYVGCFGGYVAAAGPPVLLAFVLAVMVPPVDDVLGQRLVGWLLGGLAATVAAAVAPVSLRRPIRSGLARRCRELADAIGTAAAGDRPAPVDLATVERLREQLNRLAHRPMGPSRRYRSYVGLLNSLERSSVLVGSMEPITPGLPSATEAVELARAVGDVLEATAVHLEGGPAPTLGELDEVRAAHRDALLAGLADEDADRRRQIAESADRGFALRTLANLATSAAVDATVAQGGQAPASALAVHDAPAGERAAWERGLRILRSHLHPGTVRFRNSARAAVALTVALLVAHVGQFDHAFWVVLGAVLVLRASAFDTGTTALEALGGTLVGFAVAAPFAVLSADDPTVLWVALPVAAFLAGYTTGAVGLWLGQASFTLFVVVLFNLVEPLGWITAVDRVVSVGVGAAVAVAAGILFWPRGAEAVFARAVAEHYRAAREVVSVTAASFTGTPLGEASHRRAHELLVESRERVDEAFEDLVDDRRAHLDLGDRAVVLTPPALVTLAESSLARLADKGYATPPGGAVPTGLAAQAFEVETGFTAVADSLEAESEPVWRPPPPVDVDGCVDDPDLGAKPLLGRIWLGDWLAVLGASLGRAVEPTIQTARSLDRPWWR